MLKNTARTANTVHDQLFHSIFMRIPDVMYIFAETSKSDASFILMYTL